MVQSLRHLSRHPILNPTTPRHYQILHQRANQQHHPFKNNYILLLFSTRKMIQYLLYLMIIFTLHLMIVKISIVCVSTSPWVAVTISYPLKFLLFSFLFNVYFFLSFLQSFSLIIYQFLQ